MATRMTAQTGFIEDIKPLFTQIDHDHMAKYFDLWNWGETKKYSAIILQRLQAKNMPPVETGGPWSDQKILIFENWVKDSCPKFRGQKYFDFFVDLDAHTEYCNVYNVSPDCRYMNAVGEYWELLKTKWFEYAENPTEPEGLAALEQLKQSLLNSGIKDSLLLTNTLMNDLIRKHFTSTDGTIDIEAYFDGIEKFALDVYPEDLDRYNRIPEGDGRKVHSKYHRMDGETMWFVWAGQNEWSAFIDNNVGVYGEIRRLQLAGAIYGVCLDYTFRDDRSVKAKKIPTAKGYKKDERTLNLLRKRAVNWYNDFSLAVKECHEIIQIYSN